MRIYRNSYDNLLIIRLNLGLLYFFYDLSSNYCIIVLGF